MTTPTDPLDGVVLPYSATLYPVLGTTTMHIEEEHRDVSDYRLSIPSGVATVTVTTNSGHEIRLWHRQGDGTLVQAATIPRRDGGGGSLRHNLRLCARRTVQHLRVLRPRGYPGRRRRGAPRRPGRHARQSPVARRAVV